MRVTMCHQYTLLAALATVVFLCSLHGGFPAVAAVMVTSRKNIFCATSPYVFARPLTRKTACSRIGISITGERRAQCQTFLKRTDDPQNDIFLCSPLPPTLARTSQMGVLCMAVHVPEEGGRVIIVTGGDDQAICVAELEVLHDRSAQTSDPHSPRGEEGGHDHAGSPSGQTSMRQSGCDTLLAWKGCTQPVACACVVIVVSGQSRIRLGYFTCCPEEDPSLNSLFLNLLESWRIQRNDERTPPSHRTVPWATHHCPILPRIKCQCNVFIRRMKR